MRASGRVRILVLDEDDRVATMIAAIVVPGKAEVIICSDMAVAEAAVDLTAFDLILVGANSTGVGGSAGLSAVDYLTQRNPTALTVLMVPRVDQDLVAAAQARGQFSPLHWPPSLDEIRSLLRRLHIPLSEEHGA